MDPSSRLDICPFLCIFPQVAFGMDIDIINAKDTKFTEAVSLSFHGVEEASFDLFHKVCYCIQTIEGFHHVCILFMFLHCLYFLQFKVNQYPFQGRVTEAVKFLRETGRKVIEVRKNAMKRGEEVPDDILQRIIQQQGLPLCVCP